MYQLKCKECDWKINYVIPFDLPAEVVTMKVAEQISEHFDEKHDPFNISVEFVEIKAPNISVDFVEIKETVWCQEDDDEE